MLSLIGLVGLGSIPIDVFCSGGLLTFVALVVMAFAVDQSTTNGKEKHMETKHAKTVLRQIATSLLNTIWAIGTSTWSGLAQSG